MSRVVAIELDLPDDLAQLSNTFRFLWFPAIIIRGLVVPWPCATRSSRLRATTPEWHGALNTMTIKNGRSDQGTRDPDVPLGSPGRPKDVVSGESFYKWEADGGAYLIVCLKHGVVHEKFFYEPSL
jgi:hypothetical protein